MIVVGGGSRYAGAFDTITPISHSTRNTSTPANGVSLASNAAPMLRSGLVWAVTASLDMA